MQSDFWISSLIPRGLALQSVSYSEETIVVMARAETLAALCPLCRSRSRRIHSHYVWQVSDLPSSG